MDFFPHEIPIAELSWKIFKILFLEVESQNHHWEPISHQHFQLYLLHLVCQVRRSYSYDGVSLGVFLSLYFLCVAYAWEGFMSYELRRH